jgi:hypothetical protein
MVWKVKKPGSAPLSYENWKETDASRGPVSGGSGLDGRNATDILGPFRMPRIVGALHPGPDSGAQKLAEAHGDGGRYRLSFPQDVVDVLARNSEQAGDLPLGPAGSRNNVIAK